MARNSSGTYSLPAGNPVVSGTTIDSTVHNSTLSDLGAEISDSLSRSGKGGMSAPIRTLDGTVAAPSHSFSTDTDTGLFDKGANNPAMAVGSNERQEWTTAGSKVTGTFQTTGDTTVGGALVVTGTGSVGGALNMNSHQINAVTDPSSAQDAATKNYVDVTAGTSAATVSALMRRDANGRVAVGSPAAVADAATKGYVDTVSASTAKAWAKLTLGAAGAVTVTNGSGVASASWSTSVLTVTLTNTQANTNYVAFAQVPNTSGVGCLPSVSTSTVFTVSRFATTTAAPANWNSGDIVNVLVFGT